MVEYSTEAPFRFSPRPNRAHEIPWREWGDEAFAYARANDLPVLLSISGTWCHWCHVMDEKTYSDAAVIELLSRRFVAIRVDTDARPDVNARYNAGGWPTTAFLDPEGEVIAKTTYLDPEQMLEALRGIQESWLVNRDGVTRDLEAARATRAAERTAEAGRRTAGLLTPGVLDVALEILDNAFDFERFGFREAPLESSDEDRLRLRFPHADALRLWRYAHHRRGTPDILKQAASTLRAMIDGGHYDAIDGGFYRYATQADWSLPHVEKLAADQGAILLAIAEIAGSDADAHEAMREAVERTVEYVLTTLGDSSGGLRHAQDADEAYAALDADGRAGREAPAVDPRIITASCAQTARGLLACGITYGRRDWVERGLRAVDFLVSRMRAGEAGMYHAYVDGAPEFLGLLADQAYTLLAVLHAYEISGGEGYLEQARSLARTLADDFREPGRGFWDTAEEHDDVAMLSEPLMPLAENAAVAEGLIWLGRLTHDERHLEVALETLNAFATGLEARGLAIADYARVVDRMLSAEPEFKIVAEWATGEPDRVADPLHAEALRLPLAARTVQRLSPVENTSLMEALALPLDVTKVAYVCVGSRCSSPLTDPEQLLDAVESLTDAPVW